MYHSRVVLQAIKDHSPFRAIIVELALIALLAAITVAIYWLPVWMGTKDAKFWFQTSAVVGAYLFCFMSFRLIFRWIKATDPFVLPGKCTSCEEDTLVDEDGECLFCWTANTRNPAL